MVVLAGSSLVDNTGSRLRTRINEMTRNYRSCSAFKMSTENLHKYVDRINSFKPTVLRGYPTAIYDFADFLDREGISTFKPKGIITTSEKLYPHMRELMERIFDCKVYDGYGANDGGIAAYEYECQNLHIDTERSILEVVDDDNRQVANGEGIVLATNLLNFAMPLIRYELGDQVLTTDEQCECGRGSPMLKDVIGRTVQTIYTPSGERVHGWFFQHVFRYPREQVRHFKLVQITKEVLDLHLVPGKGFGDHTVQQILDLINHLCPNWTINIHIVDDIPKSSSGKVIYIESKVKPE
jgi:phenylacetate-CoA ligase